MAMFAQSLSTLKKRASQVGGQLLKEGGQFLKGEDGSKRLDDDLFDDGGGYADASPEELAGYANGPVLVRYFVQNGTEEDRETFYFVMPLEYGVVCEVTVGMLREHFQLPGKYHLRFRAPSPDQAFGGFIWIDGNADDDVVPVIRGKVTMKALQLPEEASVRSLEPLTTRGGRLFATPMSRGSAPVPAGVTSIPGVARGGYPDGSGSFESQPQSPSPMRSDPGLLGVDMGNEASTPARRVNAAMTEPSTPMTAASPSGGGGDLMEMGSKKDLGSSANASSATQAAPPVQLDRAELVRKREEEQKRRIEEAAAKSKEMNDKDEATRAGKIEASSKLGAEMDKWAKTEDGKWKDIKVLLSTMHNVTWEGCSWQQVGLGDLIAPGAVKKNYRKAIIVMHPDKSQDAAYEVQFRADRIFHALNEAFKAG